MAKQFGNGPPAMSGEEQTDHQQDKHGNQQPAEPEDRDPEYLVRNYQQGPPHGCSTGWAEVRVAAPLAYGTGGRNRADKLEFPILEDRFQSRKLPPALIWTATFPLFYALVR
jgi:hypothetical protein